MNSVVFSREKSGDFKGKFGLNPSELAKKSHVLCFLGILVVVVAAVVDPGLFVHDHIPKSDLYVIYLLIEEALRSN